MLTQHHRNLPLRLQGEVAHPGFHPNGMDLCLVHPIIYFAAGVNHSDRCPNVFSPTEIIAFSDAAKQFADRGAQVVFASVDSEYR